MLNELIEQVDSFFDTVDGKHVGRVAWSRIKSEYLELAHLSGKAQAYADSQPVEKRMGGFYYAT
jgi:hypothetical protein